MHTIYIKFLSLFVFEWELESKQIEEWAGVELAFALGVILDVVSPT